MQKKLTRAEGAVRLREWLAGVEGHTYAAKAQTLKMDKTALSAMLANRRPITQKLTTMMGLVRIKEKILASGARAHVNWISGYAVIESRA